MDALIVAHCFFIVAQGFVDFPSLEEGFCIVRVHLDAFVETLDSFFVILKLGVAKRHVEEDRCVVVEVERIEIQTLLELLYSLLILPCLE